MKQVIAAGLLAAAGLGVIASDLFAEPAPEQIYPESWIDAMKVSVAEDPTDASTRLRLGAMLSEMGRFDEAGLYLAEAYEIDSSMTSNVLFSSPAASDESVSTSTPDERGGQFPRSGADVIVGNLPSTWPYATPDIPDMRAYGLATTSCNAGDVPLEWDADTPDHPVIAQHLYRFAEDPVTGVTKMEQIGQSWVKHGFAALTENLCASSFGYSCSPPGNSQLLGVGCSDPYGASLNANYFWLGPKHEIKADDGTFPYPPTAFPNQDPLGKRLQVHTADMDAPNAKFFAEGHYISAQDAAAGNDDNNASYRRVFIDAEDGDPDTINTYSIGIDVEHPTVRERSAIFAWQAEDPTVQIVPMHDPDGGLFMLGFDVTDLGDGTWHYEYALYNMNSDRSAQSITIPNGGNVSVSDLGFHDVDWHSGAPYTNAPWNSAIGASDVTWNTETFGTNEFANAVRWGTTYNFRFIADTPPTNGDVSVALFKPGTGAGVTFAALVPSAGIAPCLADINGDGLVNPVDLSVVLSNWGDPFPAADLDSNGVVGPPDLSILLATWGDCSAN